MWVDLIYRFVQGSFTEVPDKVEPSRAATPGDRSRETGVLDSRRGRSSLVGGRAVGCTLRRVPFMTHSIVSPL